MCEDTTHVVVVMPAGLHLPSEHGGIPLSGVAIAERLAPFKVKKFIYTDVAPRPELASIINAEYGKACSSLPAISAAEWIQNGVSMSQHVQNGSVVSFGSVSFDELAKESDFVAACCALTPETKEICNKNLFSKMKNTSIFINTSRY